MNRVSLIGRKKYKINDKITIHIPTLEEIRGENIENEKSYYSLISDFITTSTNYMVELYDCGINFEDLADDYNFFIYKNLLSEKNVFPIDCHMLFDGINKSNFKIIEHNQIYYVYDDINNILIDRDMFNQISNVLCAALFIEKKHRHFANKRTFEYVIKREKTVRKREEEKKKTSSDLDEVILFAVNNSNFKYDFDTVQKLSIFDFYASVKQMQRNEHIDNLMLGGYTGNLKLNEFSDKQLSKFNVLV